ncbi:MAG: hypothetical protein QM739_04515 [Propionivibrio sp.]
MKRRTPIQFDPMTGAERLLHHAIHSKIRLFAGIAINAVGAVVLFSESFRFLGSSL